MCFFVVLSVFACYHFRNCAIIARSMLINDEFEIFKVEVSTITWQYCPITSTMQYVQLCNIDCSSMQVIFLQQYSAFYFSSALPTLLFFMLENKIFRLIIYSTISLCFVATSVLHIEVSLLHFHSFRILL
uniref:Uncharacterized protein n=1 Tax=Parascaris univalens TaxID=6257 RepID=A0A915CGU4_PARUN